MQMHHRHHQLQQDFDDQGAAKASILKLMQNIQLKVVIFFMKIRNPWLRLTDCKKYHFSFYQVDPV